MVYILYLISKLIFYHLFIIIALKSMNGYIELVASHYFREVFGHVKHQRLINPSHYYTLS